ncbi:MULTISPECIES: hypothetical protein [Pseudoalteromonas]|uniref:Uncharacterized protein n=1 Tax=Pseudoalteromonas luteoviolacea (strain 2ta16) TaxID=1353533 RepID=V4HAW3_PSEL2|nr:MULTISPECIES: hypothetical protein [Pseudoalteromonas]ESP94621.1 hypothetical protein PL2TA16_00621 [Pseudoalteromonas luteoviolacea 2ta16]KZN32320.1 hypothetical protein N483_03985 [Pseudoalteromonas luteoviolacea NCIMB 1944]MCG7547544.1 hypothetical protein [Pseudoalteromonas sp. Of7M-16]
MNIKNALGIIVLGTGFNTLAADEIGLELGVSSHIIEVKSTNVVSIQSYTNGTVTVITGNQLLGPNSCNSRAKYIIPASETGIDITLSVLLTAKTTSQPVTLYLHGSECSSGYPKITSAVLE